MSEPGIHFAKAIGQRSSQYRFEVARLQPRCSWNKLIAGFNLERRFLIND